MFKVQFTYKPNYTSVGTKVKAIKLFTKICYLKKNFLANDFLTTTKTVSVIRIN